MESRGGTGTPADHFKRLARILQYVSSMHQSLADPEANGGHSFVREVRRFGTAETNEDKPEAPDFFQYEADDEVEENPRVMLSTNNFRRLVAMTPTTADRSEHRGPLFSFYAASEYGETSDEAASRKHTLSGAFKSAVLGRRDSDSAGGKKACWLRITRRSSQSHTSASTPPMLPDYRSIPPVYRYLQEWMESARAPSIQILLTDQYIAHAPKVSPDTFTKGEARRIHSFLLQYKSHVRRTIMHQELEPIYNRLFEYHQNAGNHSDDVLVFGLGHARMRTNVEGTSVMVNGPILEVLVEVELATDGALLVRPREHTGVALNREVMGALAGGSVSSSSSSMPPSSQALARLHQTVSNMEPSQLSPGQPATYVPLLKRMAVELSPGGTFVPSSQLNGNHARNPSKLVVTEAWCLYSRPKPASVFARDATAFAEQLLRYGTSECSNPCVPMAALSLTHGPGELDRVLKQEANGRFLSRLFQSVRKWFRGSDDGPEKDKSSTHAVYPLPASDVQLRIGDMLLSRQYPAVVVSGPPGSGKTHTIANVISAYLCRGKRVLVTSKNASALSVIRDRLPSSVHDLCVDVSTSELTGMRQLQQTVERLANRISCVNSNVETEKCQLLQKSILSLEAQLQEIDERLRWQSNKIRGLLSSKHGERMVDIALQLLESTSLWLANAALTWDRKKLLALAEQLSDLVILDSDPRSEVSGFANPPDPALATLCRSKAGSLISSLSDSSMHMLGTLPMIGSLSGLNERCKKLTVDVSCLKIRGEEPTTQSDWSSVAGALKLAVTAYRFQTQTWETIRRQHSWPEVDFRDQESVRELHHCFSIALELNALLLCLDAKEEIREAADGRVLDRRRSNVSLQLQSLAEELVDSTVVSELSRSFSPDAQSALIQFSQLAGKARFARSSQPSKMSQRQRRKRQEYLDAFDRCCRFIPCWILTTSQISDYLPPECLFDLVVIDEASQSDVTVLPGMLRGKQWLIVGDGKQVSPTECFISEEQMEGLRAALPSSPLHHAFLPGHSFFDLCQQAFPQGRVVLREHFRCAEEIIAFSNSYFYDGNLLPLRLPTKSERLYPSLVDIRVDNGVKQGKINEAEAVKIVELIQEFVADTSQCRSIGVVCLLGDEQSRLIRGRLLDAVGPEVMARHKILIGEPPMFQGAERDVVYLSMVCSRGSVPTQNQLMHFQRANVALSRARDRCVLVRSIDIKDVPSMDDIKIPIIEFFQMSRKEESPDATDEYEVDTNSVTKLLMSCLARKGYATREMGEVWRKGVCVESFNGDSRAALRIESHAGESQSEWRASYQQQKAIERVGWRCMRLDALTLVADHENAIHVVEDFLAKSGIVPQLPNATRGTAADVNALQADAPSHASPAGVGGDSDQKLSRTGTGGLKSIEERVSSAFPPEEAMDASQFGELVDLDFLVQPYDSRESQAKDGDHDLSDDSSSSGKSSYAGATEGSKDRRRAKKYRRLNRYSRDGRWRPTALSDMDDDEVDNKSQSTS